MNEDLLRSKTGKHICRRVIEQKWATKFVPYNNSEGMIRLKDQNIVLPTLGGLRGAKTTATLTQNAKMSTCEKLS